MKIGFDNDKYLKMQSAHIRERIASFGGKLYLEFGGKLFDDYHASRVLPGFLPDSKLKMLLELREDVEIIIAINANDIEKSKVRGDIGITYEQDILRLMDVYASLGLSVCGVVMTQYAAQAAAAAFEKRLQKLGVQVFRHYPIEGYPANIPLIVSDEGFGKNDYIETTRSLVVVTAPGPGSGKMAVCLSQLYHEHKRGVQAGYAKFETFPVWNLPLKHPVNLAYEAATTDLNDVNMIDPFHLEAYGKTTVNYNRDIEIFPVLNTIFERIFGTSWASAPISPPRIWASTWRASASWTMMRYAKPPGRRSSAAIIRHWSPRKRAKTWDRKSFPWSFCSSSLGSRRLTAAACSLRWILPKKQASLPPRWNCLTAGSSRVRQARFWGRRAPCC